MRRGEVARGIVWSERTEVVEASPEGQAGRVEGGEWGARVHYSVFMDVV